MVDMCLCIDRGRDRNETDIERERDGETEKETQKDRDRDGGGRAIKHMCWVPALGLWLKVIWKFFVLFLQFFCKSDTISKEKEKQKQQQKFWASLSIHEQNKLKSPLSSSCLNKLPQSVSTSQAGYNHPWDELLWGHFCQLTLSCCMIKPGYFPSLSVWG